MKGLLVNVYRPEYDATNGGVSSKADRFVLIGNGLPEIFEPDDRSTELVMIKDALGSDWIAVPADGQDHSKTPYMFGGNFVYSSDSRFIPKHPIRVHDRQETAAR